MLNIVTTYAWTGSGYVAPSAAAKAGVLALTRSLAAEWAKYKIRVNAIAPGLTNTDKMQNSTDKKHLLETINRISQKRIAEPEEIANSALFLASDLSSYISGQVIRVDGGLHE